jgi:hypothetical protein
MSSRNALARRDGKRPRGTLRTNPLARWGVRFDGATPVEQFVHEYTEKLWRLFTHQRTFQ